MLRQLAGFCRQMLDRAPIPVNVHTQFLGPDGKVYLAYSVQWMAPNEMQFQCMEKEAYLDKFRVPEQEYANILPTHDLPEGFQFDVGGVPGAKGT